ncbi:MAG TPA: hypothetical protein VFZ52_23185, partial [Chryseolinea sp.]
MKKTIKHHGQFSSARDRNDTLNKDEDRDTKKLPGYYPESEDIMNRADLTRLSLLDDNRQDDEIVQNEFDASELGDELIGELGLSESDVTGEDITALGPKDLSLDGGDDEQLRTGRWPRDLSGVDLDVPGSELDDRSEVLGSEDE